MNIENAVSLIVTLLFLAGDLGVAQAETLERSGVQYYEGTISKREWSKSSESYCHGGSEYYVLETAQGVHTLGSDRASLKRAFSLNDLKKLDGKRVSIVAEPVTMTKTKEEVCGPPEQASQCAGGISCSFLDVAEIAVIDEESAK